MASKTNPVTRSPPFESTMSPTTPTGANDKINCHMFHRDFGIRGTAFSQSFAVTENRISTGAILTIAVSGRANEIEGIGFGGAGDNRTHDRGFVDLGLTTWLPPQIALKQ